MSDEHEKYKEAAHARIGADRMALGLACIPDGIAGDLAVVSDLRKQRDALLEVCEAALKIHKMWLDPTPTSQQFDAIEALGNKLKAAIALSKDKTP